MCRPFSCSHTAPSTPNIIARNQLTGSAGQNSHSCAEQTMLKPTKPENRLLSGQDIDERLDIKEVNASTTITIRFGLKTSTGKNANEWIDVQKADATV